MPTSPSEAGARLGTDPGLCGRCRHHELLASPRSVFLRCGLAAIDPAFRRYPALPVLSCRGFAAGEPEGAERR